MAIYLNRDTFDSELLDTKNEGILTENFTYLINNLIDFITPPPQDANMPELVGGQRRIVRAQRGEGLGYQYKTAASKSTVSSKGTKTIKAFGEDVLVEEWTVSHPHVVDPQLGEVYPTQSGGSPRGPYTCLLTARVSLQRKRPTRCYVQCNCQDFKVSFYEKLNQQAYTNPQSLPPSTGKVPQTPAICKHLYAVYSKYYTKLVKDVEGFVVDVSPILFGGPNSQVGIAAPVAAPVTPRDASLLAIGKRLKAESDRLKGIQNSYLDLTKSGGGYHLFMFSVRFLNGQSKVVYRNSKSADPTFASKAAIQILGGPGIDWKFFTTQKDHDILWNLIRKHTQEMPASFKNAVKKQTGKGVYLENNEISTAVDALNENKSSILSSLSELS